jgi:Ca2+-dependent lipid-binding protein
MCGADPYVKVYLTYNGQRVAKKKTHVKKRTLNPVFNESFAFDLPASSCGGAGDDILHGIRLEFVVYDWDRVTRNEVIGRVEIGDRIRETEGHWNEVVNCPRKQIAEWHHLKP